MKSDISYRKLEDVDTLKLRQDILSSELYTRPASTLEERYMSNMIWYYQLLESMLHFVRNGDARNEDGVKVAYKLIDRCMLTSVSE